jgi:hypothetical protein
LRRNRENSSGNPDRLKLLRWIGAVAWLACLSAGVIIWWIARRNVMHPHFLPLGGTLIVLVVAEFWGLGVGIGGVIRGPGRLRFARWTAVSVAPLLLVGSLSGLGLVFAVKRDIPSWLDRIVPPRLFLRTLSAAAAPILDGLARITYPHRLAGEKSVMLYDTAPFPEEDVAAMDRHIERMEKFLGRRCDEKVHWVRGPMLRILWGFGFQGLAFGNPADPAAEAGGLSSVDRHEAAHCVLQQLAGAEANPPSFLAEGWAESQSGGEPGELAHDAFEERRRGLTPSLAELAGPEFYYHSRREVYLLGGALVDFLLRRYGGEKFFLLCSTCREETFAEDCQCVLGVGLDELDRLYWADVRRQVAEVHRKAERPGCVKSLLPLPATGYERGDLVPVFMDRRAAEKTAPAADVAARKAFLAEYPEAFRKLTEAYRHVRMRGRGHGFRPMPEGKWERDYSVTCSEDGPRHHSRIEEEGETAVVVVTPEKSCLLRKGPTHNRYSVVDSDTGFANSQTHYLGPILWCDRYLPRPYRFPIVDFQHGPTIADWIAAPDVVVRDIVAMPQAGRSLVKVSFELRINPYHRRDGWFLLDPARGWALSEIQLRTLFEGAPANTVVCRITYGDVKDVPPAVKSVSFRIESEDAGVFFAEQTEVEEVRFGPIDDREFDQDRYPIKRGWQPWTAYGCAAAGLLLVLVALAVLFRLARRQSSTAAEEPDATPYHGPRM